MNKYIALILLAFLTSPARAEEVAASIAPPPANLNDEALASYITGRLSVLLQDEDYKVSQSCDASGCSVTVQ